MSWSACDVGLHHLWSCNPAAWVRWVRTREDPFAGVGLEVEFAAGWLEMANVKRCTEGSKEGGTAGRGRRAGVGMATWTAGGIEKGNAQTSKRDGLPG